jgi:hypothetical protein
MNTKSALIIAVAIVIGFSIEPILDRIVPLKESPEIHQVVFIQLIKSLRRQFWKFIIFKTNNSTPFYSNSWHSA